jgi:hypothetical protein
LGSLGGTAGKYVSLGGTIGSLWAAMLWMSYGVNQHDPLYALLSLAFVAEAVAYYHWIDGRIREDEGDKLSRAMEVL